MKTTTLRFSGNDWHIYPSTENNNLDDVQVVICFASKNILGEKDIYERVRKKFPNSQIAFCSTAGEISQEGVLDNSFIVSALSFDRTEIRTAEVNIADFENSYDAAKGLIKKMSLENLTYVLILSDGGLVNGSELVRGLNEAVDNKILITGGLAGDGPHFSSTLVGLNKQPATGNIVAIGFYGPNLIVTHGSQGGWDTFGPEREVTKSNGNNLYEIDNKSALDIYEKYLGPEAENLPGSALLFPLSVIIPGSTKPVTRTILSVDPEKNSMTFAGDIPEGSKVRFMKANFDKLTSAAANAAQDTLNRDFGVPAFSLLVSCVGRKLVLGARIDEEVQSVIDTIGNKTPIAGFYSYGEISPFNDNVECQLQNQTMTITSFYEHS